MDTSLSAERDPQNPKLWQCGDSSEYQHSPKRDSNGKPLQKINKRMKDYDKGMCDAWRDEIEKLLIFAGLFAGTVTPFAIDSYKWLQEDNAAASTSLPDSSAFTRSVRINAAWFLSLVICLSTVILGILCLQWLREYTRESSFMASFDAITVRQTRHEGLVYWKVPDLISFLPIALQVSVLLFFGGILDLLWSLHPAVAAVTTIAVGLVAAALIFTTIAPVVQSAYYFHKPLFHAAMKQCPYKSPLSWLLLRLAVFVDQHRLFPDDSSLYGPLTSWDVFDVTWDQKQTFIGEGKNKYNVERFAKSLDWITKTLTPAGAQSDIIPEIFHSLSDLPRTISYDILRLWATDIGANVAQNLKHDSHDSLQYDLLVTWFLRRYSFISNSDDLLMELRLRCLNTDKGQMNEMFEDVLQDYQRTIAFSDVEDASMGKLRFQAMATILDYYRRHPDSSSIDHVYLIGQAVAEYIRCTPVKNDNALMCYEIYKRLEGQLEDTRSSMQPRTTSTQDHTTSVYEPSKVNSYAQIAALLLGRLDLRKVEEWEENFISGITGKRISVSSQLNSFLGEHLLPVLDAQPTLESLATQVRDQLNDYANKVRREAPVT